MCRMPGLRDWVTIGIIVCLTAGVAGVVGTIFFGWAYHLPITNRGELDMVVIGLVSLGLIIVGTVVALFAYRTATATPGEGRTNLEPHPRHLT